MSSAQSDVCTELEIGFTNPSPREEIKLYFAIIACHMSNISRQLLQTTLKTPYLQSHCKILANYMKVLSHYLLRSHSVLQYSIRDIPHSPTIFHLKNCIRFFNGFDSFNLAIQHKHNPSMDQIQWSMIEFKSDSERYKQHGISAGYMPLYEILRGAAAYILDAVKRFLDDLEALKLYNLVLQFDPLLRDLPLPEKIVSGTFSVKDLPQNRNNKPRLAERHVPRNIEKEHREFLATSKTFSSTPSTSTMNNSTTQNDLQERPRQSDENSISETLENLSGTLFVSVNGKRPKRKMVEIRREIFYVEKTKTFSESGTILRHNCILLIIQRPGNTNSHTLTVYGHDQGSSRGINLTLPPSWINSVQSAEIFFDNEEVFKAWKVALKRCETVAFEVSYPGMDSHGGKRSILR